MSTDLIDAYSEIEAVEDGEKPWCDLAFDLTEVEVLGKKSLFGFGKDERSLKAVARAMTPRGEIGFAFETAPVARWTSGESSAWGRVALRSIGEPTDRLVREYESWWELTATDSPAVDEIWCQAVLLSEKPDALIDGIVNLKLFFQGAGGQDDEGEEEGDEDREPSDYGELYLNFGVRHRRAQLREKDPDYREAVTGFLSGRIPAGDLDHG